MVTQACKVLVDYLANNGFDTFFLVTGGAIAPTVDYIGTKKGIQYFCFQHEQSAAMAAEAYYRATGKVVVVLSTSGPGAQNLLNGLCGCWFESIPCIFITGQVSTYESSDSIEKDPRQLGFQETAVVEIFKPFTKYCSKVCSVDEVESTFETAIEEMLKDRYGPVLIDIPVNIQTTDVADFSDNSVKKPLPKIDDNIDSKIDELYQLIAQSERPLFLLGNGIRLSNSIDKAKKLIEKTGYPFVVSWGGFDLLPHDHPGFMGDIGVYGSRGANFAVQNCDLLIVLGSRLDTRQTGGDPKLFSRHSKKVMVDVDENEIFKGRGLVIDLPIVNDLGDFFDRLEEKNKYTKRISSSWGFWLRDWKEKKFDSHSNTQTSLNAYKFLESLNNHLDPTDIIIPDEGGNLVWAMQSLKIKGSQRMFSNFGNSSMGYALPAAIGAAIGSNNRVICIDGDGGFQMNLQELQTVVHYNIPIKIFILNNLSYGIIKQFQDAYFGSRYVATQGKDYSPPKFAAVADAYGIKSCVIDLNSNLDLEIDKMMSYDGPVLCEVLIDTEQKLTPKLEFGRPLEDMSPYLSEETLKHHMIVPRVKRIDPSHGWITLEDK